MQSAALLGCAIPTALGTIFNVAKPANVVADCTRANFSRVQYHSIAA